MCFGDIALLASVLVMSFACYRCVPVPRMACDSFYALLRRSIYMLSALAVVAAVVSLVATRLCSCSKEVDRHCVSVIPASLLLGLYLYLSRM